MLRNTTLGAAALGFAPGLFAAAPSDRYQIGIQEYTFNRWLKSGKLKHLDYPTFAAEKLGVNIIEYWSTPFAGKHTDKAFVGELVKRTKDANLENLLILVGNKDRIDAPDAAQRDRSLDAHKAWIDCAAQMGCKAIRVDARSAGDPDINLKNAVDGLGRLCDYAKNTPVKVVVEPHGGHSQNPDWLVRLHKEIARPNFGLLPDFNNFGKYDRYDGVTKCLPHAVAVCAKSLNFDDKGNETRTDFYRMLEIIEASTFKGVISIEFEGHNVDPVEGALQTKALLLKAIAAAKK